MNEINALIQKIEAKIEGLERKRSRLQDDLGQVRRTEKIRLKYEGNSECEEEEGPEEITAKEADSQELNRLRERMAGHG